VCVCQIFVFFFFFLECQTGNVKMPAVSFLKKIFYIVFFLLPDPKIDLENK